MDKLVLSFYNKILIAKEDDEVYILEVEVQEAILNDEIKNEKDIMLLNMAIQIKHNYFAINALMVMNGLNVLMESF